MNPGTVHIKGQELKPEVVPLEFDLDNEHYSGHAIPIKATGSGEKFLELDVTINAEHLGSIYCGSGQWTMKGTRPELVEKIGQLISTWYES